MQSQGYITVIFVTEDKDSELNARFTAFMEHLVHPSDLGYRQIHAEIAVGHRGYSAVGRPPNQCVIKYNFDLFPQDHPYVDFVLVPVTDVSAAQNVVETFSSTNATYQIPYMKFLIPSPFVSDVDLDPNHWGHMFCSQFVLLCLRKMAQLGLIPLARERLEHLYDCSSLTCTPAHLKHMLDKILKS
jgi:hypothetical protein